MPQELWFMVELQSDSNNWLSGELRGGQAIGLEM